MSIRQRPLFVRQAERVCRLSDVVMLFAPAVLVFNVSKFLRFAVSKFQGFNISVASWMLVSCAMRLFQSFIASQFHATVLCYVRLRRSVVLKC